jgi:hypothetical protein
MEQRMTNRVWFGRLLFALGFLVLTAWSPSIDASSGLGGESQDGLATSLPAGWHVWDSTNSPFGRETTVKRIGLSDTRVVWVMVEVGFNAEVKVVRGTEVAEGAIEWGSVLSPEGAVEGAFSAIIQQGSLRGFWTVDRTGRVWVGARAYDGRRWSQVAAIGDGQFVTEPALFDDLGVGYVVALDPMSEAAAVVFDHEGERLASLDLGSLEARGPIRAVDDTMWVVTPSGAACVSCSGRPFVAFPEGMTPVTTMRRRGDVAMIGPRGNIEMIVTGPRAPVYVSTLARIEMVEGNWVQYDLDSPPFQLLQETERSWGGERFFVATDRHLAVYSATNRLMGTFEWSEDWPVGGWGDIAHDRLDRLWLGGVGGIASGPVDSLGDGLSLEQPLFLPVVATG